ncbi:MAG: DNA methylase [Idiomarina sp.]|nr:DNA methylase [Idiomarina sp.]
MQQDNLFTEQAQTDKPAGPVTCLGKTFANDAERRAYFTALLAEKLKDPEFRKIEGLPIGSNEDILNLSDPPYYTACPNPWIADFIAQWEAEKSKQPEGYHYHREPFAADVSEGKNDPIYNAHSYHTKVPHKAIMRYILHYTNPGDVVFDGFCGSGMTGVAAQMCGNRDEVLSLGYQVTSDGEILKEEVNESGGKSWIKFSLLGERKVLLSDLSPIATFIAKNYNSPVVLSDFEKKFNEIISALKSETSWLYETNHEGGKGEINYTVWSDVFLCPECSSEIIFWEQAVDQATGSVKDLIPCKTCGAKNSKNDLSRLPISKFDSRLGSVTNRVKQVPVLIQYTFNGKRYQKKPDAYDIELINKIESLEIPYDYPIDRMPLGKESRRNDPSGITHCHQFFTKRNLWALSSLYSKIKDDNIKFLFTGILNRSSLMNRIHLKKFFFGGGGWNAGYLKGTLYISSIPIETSVFEQLCDRFKAVRRALEKLSSNYRAVCSLQSMTNISIRNDTLDYIFIDPPFGANLNYSELSFLWEAWLKVKTNNELEAIEDTSNGKNLLAYRNIMSACFAEAYRVLKPGRWVTVEFSNTSSAVWNSIQSSLNDSGFIVANVSALDKKQGSFKAVTTPTAVKQDLVISAYKPNGGFEDRFKNEAKTEAGVWDFIRTHLQYLPLLKIQDNSLLQIPERDPRILFDQVVTYYVRKGYQLPVSSQEFQTGLAQRFIERDGMYFLDEQAAEYDKKKTIVGELVQTSLFVKDEASAIQWLRQLLKLKPQLFSDINPQFMQQLSGWSKNEVQLDLRELLNQNFLCYDGKDEVPEQIHSYLSTNWKELRNLAKTAHELKAKAKDRWYVPDPNKAGDLEKLRERSLLKEFEEYKTAKKKLKVFRIEAVRTGFKKLWEAQDFASILEISTKLPNNVIAEDPILLMYYDQAMMLSQNNSNEDW